jgi:hypothetical protein
LQPNPPNGALNDIATKIGVQLPRKMPASDVSSPRFYCGNGMPRHKSRRFATETSLGAMEALLLVAESDGPTMFARIGVMRALNRSKPPPKIVPRRKRAKAYRIT